MEYTPYYFMISQGQESSVRAWLNDVPFYRLSVEEAANRTGPAIHLLRPGVNTFAIEIDRAPDSTVVFFGLLLEFDTKNPVFYFEWPREAAHLPWGRRTPFYFEARFMPPGELFKPVYLESSAESVPCAGTPDLREAVRRFHATLENRDLEGYCAALSLKAKEYERAYPGWDGASVEAMRSEMASFFREDLHVGTLDLDDVHFEARADGRLVHARHTRRAHLIDAVSKEPTPDGFAARVTTDLTFTRHRGEWKIFF